MTSPIYKAFDDLAPHEKQQDFHEKDSILASVFPEVPPLTFYHDYLFRDLPDGGKVSMILYEQHEGSHRQALELDGLMDYFHRTDAAISPAGYHHNYVRNKLMNTLYAFVMDVDKVRPRSLSYLMNCIEKGDFPRPTVVTNSGSGVHFYFILDEAMQVGNKEKLLINRKIAGQIYFMLHTKLREIYPEAQKHWMGQDYRVVGSLTKFGDRSTAWESGRFWSVEDLAKAVGVKTDDFYRPINEPSARMTAYAKSIAKSLKVHLPEKMNAREMYDFIEQNKDEAYRIRQESREKKGKTRNALGWYRDTWRRVYTKTQAGNRFNAMRGLAIVAYKCNVPEETFTADLIELSELWQVGSWKGDNFNHENVEAIIRMFRNGERYKTTSRKRLEELFGWQWNGKPRRMNGRTRTEHIEYMNFSKSQKKRSGTLKNPEGRPVGHGTKEQIVKDYIQANPSATVTQIAKALGVSRPTVYKFKT